MEDVTNIQLLKLVMDDRADPGTTLKFLSRTLAGANACIGIANSEDLQGLIKLIGTCIEDIADRLR